VKQLDLLEDGGLAALATTKQHQLTRRHLRS
jgi:hypothetical protein